jgi:UDP-N-acetylglucosamine 2-epimerase (non-hydrolysing)
MRYVRVILIVGTRPQIIKSAPIIHEMMKRKLDFYLIHTGQHYDYEMSKIFLDELKLPDPIVNLGVGSGSHAYQTGEIMLKLEKALLKEKPDLVVVPGDTNSALAAALTAVKLNIPVAHIEAGARSYDMTMAEEINRRLIDHCSTMLFTASKNCKKNLEQENISGQVYVSGDTMYDAFIQHIPRANESSILDKLKLAKEEYGVLTLHRAENVDDECKLTEIMRGISKCALKTVFPVHPRTRERLMESNIKTATNLLTINPVSYHDMLKLLMHSQIILTDSGGLQKEAFYANVPCVTLRENTEWTETVHLGVNILAGSNSKTIINAVKSFLECPKKIKQKWKKIKNPYGTGRASEIIINDLTKYFEGR